MSEFLRKALEHQATSPSSEAMWSGDMPLEWT